METWYDYQYARITDLLSHGEIWCGVACFTLSMPRDLRWHVLDLPYRHPAPARVGTPRITHTDSSATRSLFHGN